MVASQEGLLLHGVNYLYIDVFSFIYIYENIDYSDGVPMYDKFMLGYGHFKY